MNGILYLIINLQWKLLLSLWSLPLQSARTSSWTRLLLFRKLTLPKPLGLLVITITSMARPLMKLKHSWELLKPQSISNFPSKKWNHWRTSQKNSPQQQHGLNANPLNKLEIKALVDLVGLSEPLKPWVTESVSPVDKNCKPESLPKIS